MEKVQQHNGAHYSEMLRAHACNLDKMKRPTTPGGCVLYDNAHPGTAAKTTNALQKLHLELLQHAAYSSHPAL